ncbi:TRAP transporter permease [Sulfitobacter mediterraneus]|uniref:TRAP transporter permease n=1 Tax=Sulfitobacter mediterraneus TaxID=83219 RepID=UPI0021A5EB39|nr:TRAP transporter fused permease subunit [Sulfitobacter mediterraneus]UWR13393.1 TRAP transporter fused permease subunit [Sulfitobacter mediterraneus]
MFGLFMLGMVLSAGFSVNAQTTRGRWIGVLADGLFVATVAVFLLAYLDQKETVPFQLFPAETAEQAPAELSEEDADLAAVMGFDDFEDETLNPNPPGDWVLAAFLMGVTFFLAYNIKIWGFPVVAFSAFMATYAAITYAFHTLGWVTGSTYWSTEINNPAQFFKELLINDQRGLLGQFLGVLLQTVFPYIVLGTLFGGSAGGRSLIKLAVLLTQRLRGGSAHAAIVSSALFGTVSGGPVVNVLSTGTLTIPMMHTRGFSRTFAGGVESAASSGGQIMPPVMGVAAFLLAALTQVGYANVVVAALVPAIFYFGSLFLTVMFESRKQGIKAVAEQGSAGPLNRQDWLSLITIFVPISIIIVVLVTTANERAAGWYAALSLLPLAFLDPDIRRKPSKLLIGVCEGGLMISTLFLMFMAVTIVDASLNITGFATDFKNSVLSMIDAIKQFTIFGVEVTLPAGLYLFFTLSMGMVAAIILGMGMPTVPAYANAALIMGPVLGALGTSIFTAHMFVFYFAVASAITPPVAIAAFAAASVAKTEPIKTAIAAVRIGFVMFAIPFVFAFYPELLLIDQAFVAPSGEYIDGRPQGFETTIFLSVVLRLIVSLYLISSAFTGYDMAAIGRSERWLRFALGIAVLATSWIIFVPAIALGAVLVARSFRTTPVEGVT